MNKLIIVHKQFIRFVSFFIFLLVTSVSLSQGVKEPDYKEALRLIDIWLDAQVDFERLPGMSVAIVKDQNIIYSKGFGVSDIEKKSPTTQTTVYSICSVSKLFTSIAIMKLWEQGKLRLDDSVKAVLPSFNLYQQYEESGPITIRSLLTHSSGLPRESDFPYWSAPEFKFPTEKEVGEKIGKQQTLYPSSTYFQYSNLGMSVLGAIITRVSGMPYEKYIQENILDPLRLGDTRTYLPETLWREKMATGYDALHRDGRRQMMPFFKAKGLTSAAGFSSTVEDLARFISWQFRLLKSGGKEILKASTLREMQRVHWIDPDWKSSWGLGFEVHESGGSTIVGHRGSCPGYVTSLVMNPREKLGIVVMVNAQGVNVSKYTNAIIAVLKKSKPLDNTNNNDSLNLEAYSGYYDAYAWSGETVIIPWQGKLVVFDVPSTNPLAEAELFKHIKGDVFRRIRSDESLGEEIRFERNLDKKVISVWQHSNYLKKLDSKGE